VDEILTEYFSNVIDNKAINKASRLINKASKTKRRRKPSIT